MKVAALIVAAGSGQRARAPDEPPKQFATLGTKSILAHAVSAFVNHTKINLIQVVIAPEHDQIYRPALNRLLPSTDLLPPVHGGKTRQASVFYGLQALLDHQPDVVLIHDAARPFVGQSVIDRVLAGLDGNDAAIPAVPAVDTIKRTDSHGKVLTTVDRNDIWFAQTPQGFRFEKLLKAHREAAQDSRLDFTDDAAIAEWAGLDVLVVAGDKQNMKLTTRKDLAMASALAVQAEETVVGTGFDVHRFCDGDHVVLCGIKIAHTRGLEGHSDADVALHALTDALLGATGEEDIGGLFPPSDPQWRDAPSKVFLEEALKRVRKKNAQISNVDLTLICEEPKIGPHRQQMRDNLESLLGLSIDRIGIKATTTEGLGFTGRKEGIAALASVSLRLSHK